MLDFAEKVVGNALPKLDADPLALKADPTLDRIMTLLPEIEEKLVPFAKEIALAERLGVVPTVAAELRRARFRARVAIAMLREIRSAVLEQTGESS